MRDIDYAELEWEYTGNEEVIALAQDGINWYGACAMWMDTMPADRANGEKDYLAFIACVEVAMHDYDEAFERAYDLCSMATDGDVDEELGWFDTYEEACDALKEELALH